MLRQYGQKLRRVWMGADVAVSCVVFLLLYAQPALRRVDSLTDADLARILLLGFGASLGWPLLLQRCGAYRSNRRQPIAGQLARVAAASGVGALLLSTLAFAVDAPVAPVFPLAVAVTMFVVHAAVRVPLFYAIQSLRRSGRNFRNVLIIGSGPRALQAKETIDAHPEWGLRIIGYVDDGDGDFRPSVPGDEIHKLIDVPKLLRDYTVDEALVACPRRMLGEVGPVVRECSLIGVRVTILTDLFGFELPPPRPGSFDHVGTLSYAPVHHDDISLALKRGVDFFGGVVGLVLSAPLLAAAAAAIKLDSKGPVFYRQLRSGVNGRSFWMFKLRTMEVDADAHKADLVHLNEMDGPVFKMEDDPRVTRVGRFLRVTSIDELPQFWNVLRADMSLVGPRPPTPDEVVQYQGGERRRLSMRPGLTCLWQVSGRNEVSFDEWMKLDMDYIDSWSLSLDLRIMLRTIPVVLFRRGAR